jgi:hypothetical protein
LIEATAEITLELAFQVLGLGLFEGELDAGVHVDLPSITPHTRGDSFGVHVVPRRRRGRACADPGGDGNRYDDDGHDEFDDRRPPYSSVSGRARSSPLRTDRFGRSVSGHG